MSREKATECPLTSAAEVLGRKWTLVIVGHLLDGGKRFSELESEIEGISSKVLSSTLKGLTERGVVERRVDTESPIRVTYALTEQGNDMEGLVEEVKRWAERWSL